ncbi:MAG: peptide ABC transporter substrate-binding protein [Dehalococcoidia bacterium]|nr:MAG: peptide ABC transporter substrate-binding protein [Dehalococcoidia bacterium]
MFPRHIRAAALRGLALSAALLATAACSTGGEKKDVPAQSQPAADGGTAAASGTITIQGLQFETWDPHFSNFAQDISHFYMVWRGLYEFDLNSKPVPSMAEAMPAVSPDGLTYTVKLRQGLKWSDGSALTADDFVLGLQRTCNPDIAGHYQYILSAVAGCDAYYASNGDSKATPPKPGKSAEEKETLRKAVGVRAVDANTVEYKLTSAQPTFTILLAMWPTFPVPSKKVTAADAKWLGPLENVYNGPFMPSAYTEKSSITLVPNPNWAGKQKAQVAKIVIKYIDDLSVANNAYRAGEIDATGVNLVELDAVQKDPTLSKELVEYPATRTIGLEFNLADPLMANKDLRMALSQATDRVTLNKVPNKGANVPTTNWMPPERSGTKLGTYDSSIGFDVAKAKASLAASKLTPADIKITLLLTDSPTNKAIGEFLQSEWKKHLGIDVKLEFVDSKTRSARFNSGQYQLVTGGWQEDYPDPENWMIGLWETKGSINKTKTSVAALDDVIAKAKFNQNDEARRQQYRDAEKILLDGVNGIAPLWHTGNHRLVKPYISGMKESKRPGDTFVAGDWNPENWKTSKK